MSTEPDITLGLSIEPARLLYAELNEKDMDRWAWAFIRELREAIAEYERAQEPIYEYRSFGRWENDRLWGPWERRVSVPPWVADALVGRVSVSLNYGDGSVGEWRRRP